MPLLPFRWRRARDSWRGRGMGSTLRRRPRPRRREGSEGRCPPRACPGPGGGGAAVGTLGIRATEEKGGGWGKALQNPRSSDFEQRQKSIKGSIPCHRLMKANGRFEWGENYQFLVAILHLGSVIGSPSNYSHFNIIWAHVGKTKTSNTTDTIGRIHFLFCTTLKGETSQIPDIARPFDLKMPLKSIGIIHCSQSAGQGEDEGVNGFMGKQTVVLGGRQKRQDPTTRKGGIVIPPYETFWVLLDHSPHELSLRFRSRPFYK